MSPKQIEDVVEQVVVRYLDSDDFNGLLWTAIAPKLPIEGPSMREALTELVKTGRISFRTASLDPNPGIKRGVDLPTEEEMQMANEVDLDHLTLYPTIQEMSGRPCRVNPRERPFTALLAQGHAQLDYCCFDLVVLEHYRNDPRYVCKASDVEGHIFKAHESSPLKEVDRIFLQTFGFAYDHEFNRAVAVYIRYLNDLTGEHQRIWQEKLLPRTDYKLHPDYFRMTLVGDFATHYPILDAFTLELHHINCMSELMGKPSLFRSTFRDQHKPKKFTFLIRPTSHEFNDFVLLLDKMMSDNINKEFFRGDISLEEDQTRKDGKIEVRQIGTIRLLEEWIKKRFVLSDPKPMDEAMQAFREVRKLRQCPAHAIEPDKFDQAFFRQQRDLIIRAYTAIRFVRLLFANHPIVKGYQVEEVLAAGRIRNF